MPKKIFSNMRETKTEKQPDALAQAIDSYNMAYTDLSDKGMKLFQMKERSIDLVDEVEFLINSIANHPKTF